LSQSPIQLDAPDPALDSGRRLRGRGRGGIQDYLEAAGHGDDEQGPLFRPIRNNRTGPIEAHDLVYEACCLAIETDRPLLDVLLETPAVAIPPVPTSCAP
jgi:hypothetical protein